jgi:hypothetical protein
VKRTITVLQDDIDKGKPQDSDKCAIALAATRDLADLMVSDDHIGVGTSIVIWKGGVCRTRAGAELPITATNFISHFDNRDAVEPFKFEIDICFNEED